MHISHIGQAYLYNHTSKQLHLTNVLQVPSITRNLLSVCKFTCDNNIFVEFHPSDVFVKDIETREVLLSGHSRHGLYELDVSPASQVFTGARVSLSQWHSRLGHPATPIVRHVIHCHELPIQSSSNHATFVMLVNKAI
jgi:hypothetical protein